MVAETLSSPGGRPFRAEGFVPEPDFLGRVVGFPDGLGSLSDVPVYTRVDPGVPQWYDDDHVSLDVRPGARTVAIGQIASGRFHAVEVGVTDDVATDVEYVNSDYLDPVFERDAQGISDEMAADLEIGHAVDDAFAEVMQRLDPLGELDPDHELLDDCALYAIEMHRDYDGLEDFPKTFLRDLYERELRYVAFRDGKLNEILELNAALGITVREVDILDDFDRSQVAVVDPRRKPTGDEKADAMLSKMRHRVRPGWGYWTKRAAARLYEEGIMLRQGAISDRMQQFDEEQTSDTSGKNLVEIAYDHFRQAGIERFADPALVISSTDGEWVKDAPKFMKPEMRHRARYTKSERAYRIPRRILDLRERKRKAAVAEISMPDRLANERLHYHDKVGAVLIHSRLMDSSIVTLWFDDMSSTDIVHSHRVMGAHVDKTKRPLLPDDEYLYDDYLSDLLF